MIRRLALTGAITTSATGVAMAAAAALERGGSPVDRALIIAVAVTITLAAHLLPALSRKATAWALWSVCVALTVYGHGTFFLAAADRAGQARAAAVQPDTRTAALREQVSSAPARDPVTVADAIARTQSRLEASALALTRCQHATPHRCGAQQLTAQQTAARLEALRVEMTQSTRLQALREQITTAAERHDQRRADAAADPIAAALASATGLPAQHITTLASVLSAVVVELLATLLWAELLAQQGPSTAPGADAITPVTTPRPTEDSTACPSATTAPEGLTTPQAAVLPPSRITPARKVRGREHRSSA